MEFTLEAFLVDPWEKAFGLKQVTIYEAGMKVGITFEPFFSFGLAGKFKLVDSVFEFAVAFNPADESQNVFYAEINNLNFTTLVKGTADCDIPEPLNKFTDNFLLRKGELSVATPGGVVLFEKSYDGGISAQIDLVMFNFEV